MHIQRFGGGGEGIAGANPLHGITIEKVVEGICGLANPAAIVDPTQTVASLDQDLAITAQLLDGSCDRTRIPRHQCMRVPGLTQLGHALLPLRCFLNRHIPQMRYTVLIRGRVLASRVNQKPCQQHPVLGQIPRSLRRPITEIGYLGRQTGMAIDLRRAVGALDLARPHLINDLGNSQTSVHQGVQIHPIALATDNVIGHANPQFHPLIGSPG